MELSSISRSLWLDIGIIVIVGFGAYFITDFFQPRFQGILQKHQEVKEDVEMYKVFSEYENPDLLSSQISYLPTGWNSSDIQRVVSRVLQEEGVTSDGIQLGEGQEESNMQASGRFDPVYREGEVTIDFQSNKNELQNVIERFENEQDLEWFMRVARLNYGEADQGGGQIQGSIQLKIYYK